MQSVAKNKVPAVARKCSKKRESNDKQSSGWWLWCRLAALFGVFGQHYFLQQLLIINYPTSFIWLISDIPY